MIEPRIETWSLLGKNGITYMTKMTRFVKPLHVWVFYSFYRENLLYKKYNTIFE